MTLISSRTWLGRRAILPWGRWENAIGGKGGRNSSSAGNSSTGRRETCGSSDGFRISSGFGVINSLVCCGKLRRQGLHPSHYEIKKHLLEGFRRLDKP